MADPNLSGAEVGDERRRELVEAACDVFFERGYTSAGVAEIAKRADLSTGTFYNYFDSKRDILDHVLDEAVERVADAVRAGGDQGPPETLAAFADRLEGAADRVFALMAAETWIGRVVFLDAASIDAELSNRLLGIKALITAAIAAFLDQGIDSGYLRDDLDTEVTANALLTLVVPWMLASLREPSGAPDRTRYVKAMLRLAIGGVQAADHGGRRGGSRGGGRGGGRGGTLGLARDKVD